MYYTIFDIKKAIYEVDDLQGALSNTAQTQLKVRDDRDSIGDTTASPWQPTITFVTLVGSVW
jgi:hypothetical protein